MNDERVYGEAGGLSNASMIGEEASRTIQRTINNNNAVGTIIGYYDDELTILSVSDFMLYNLGYSYEEFQRALERLAADLPVGALAERLAGLTMIGRGRGDADLD